MPIKQTEQASVKHNGARIEYTIIRSARRKKTIEIALDPQRGVLVRAPNRTPRKDIADLVRARADWIIRKTQNSAPPQSRRFVDGETLPYLGRELPIVTEPVQGGWFGVAPEDGSLEISVATEDGSFEISVQTQDDLYIAARIENDAFRIRTPAGISEEQRIATARAALEQCYRKEAERLLPEAVARWQSKVSRKVPSRVLIRSQRKRWGSCSSDGSIRLNWRIVMAEPAIIDYVVVHELAHLEVMNHSPSYWKCVERALPEYKARRKRLNDVGAGFWF